MRLLCNPYYLFLWFGLLGACSNGKTPARPPHNGATVDYQLDAPAKTFKLDKKLREISGLTCYKDEFLCAVQDEQGNLYQLSKKDGDIKHKVDFSADGDYEGLACYQDKLFALRADGVLFELTDWEDAKKAHTRVIDTNLGEINDTEGVTYDPRTKQLWIACKGSAQIGQTIEQERGVYAYDLALDSFYTTPVFTLSRKQVHRYIKQHLKNKPHYAFYKKLFKKERPNLPLQPSGIAIHPVTEDIYLLCAVGSSLIVLRRDFSIRQLYYLSEELFEQPEGIAFDSKGNMYLSSEGVKKQARIHYFPYRAS